MVAKQYLKLNLKIRWIIRLNLTSYTAFTEYFFFSCCFFNQAESRLYCGTATSVVVTHVDTTASSELFLCVLQTCSLQCITTQFLNSQMRLVKGDIQVGGGKKYSKCLHNSSLEQCCVLEALVWWDVFCIEAGLTTFWRAEKMAGGNYLLQKYWQVTVSIRVDAYLQRCSKFLQIGFSDVTMKIFFNYFGFKLWPELFTLWNSIRIELELQRLRKAWVQQMK